MQRDDWYSTARDPQRIAAPEAIGDYAARRALSRLNARKIRTRKVPVLFEAPLAASLIGHFVHAASGGSLYRKTSFLVDALGKPIFSKKVRISERPHLRGGLASSLFDNDGVATRERGGLLRKMGRGLLVTELLGHGVNYVNGDYSRGAAGYWIEDGQVAYPVEEITIAGNLRDMFRHIVAVGNDVLVRGSKQVGSILVDEMKVAGN